MDTERQKFVSYTKRQIEESRRLGAPWKKEPKTSASGAVKMMQTPNVVLPPELVERYKRKVLSGTLELRVLIPEMRDKLLADPEIREAIKNKKIPEPTECFG